MYGTGMRITFVLVAISLLALGVLTLSIITLQDSPDALNVLTNITSDVASLCATIACWLAYLLIPKDFLGEKRGWLLTALALTLFTFGDMYWSYSEIILGIEVPLGSIADWAWTLAYFVLLAGIYFIYTGMYFETKQKYVIMTLTLVIAAVFGYYHITHLISEAHGFIELVQEGYILYDIILLGMLAVMLLPLIASHNRLMNVWQIGR